MFTSPAAPVSALSDKLQQVDSLCMMRSTVGGHISLWMALCSLFGNTLWRIVASQLRNSAVISRRFPAPRYTKLHARWVPKQLTPEYKAKRMESVAVPWWQRVSGSDHHRWWNVGCTHYPGNQAAINAMASQWISLQDEIRANFFGT